MINALEKKRKEIDALDSRLAPLLAERFAIVKSLAGLKRTIRDAEREKAVLKHVGGLVKDEDTKFAVKSVYKELMKQGRRILRLKGKG